MASEPLFTRTDKALGFLHRGYVSIARKTGLCFYATLAYLVFSTSYFFWVWLDRLHIIRHLASLPFLVVRLIFTHKFTSFHYHQWNQKFSGSLRLYEFEASQRKTLYQNTRKLSSQSDFLLFQLGFWATRTRRAPLCNWILRLPSTRVLFTHYTQTSYEPHKAFWLDLTATYYTHKTILLRLLEHGVFATRLYVEERPLHCLQASLLEVIMSKYARDHDGIQYLVRQLEQHAKTNSLPSHWDCIFQDLGVFWPTILVELGAAPFDSALDLTARLTRLGMIRSAVQTHDTDLLASQWMRHSNALALRYGQESFTQLTLFLHKHGASFEPSNQYGTWDLTLFQYAISHSNYAFAMAISGLNRVCFLTPEPKGLSPFNRLEFACTQQHAPAAAHVLYRLALAQSARVERKFLHSALRNGSIVSQQTQALRI